MRKLFLLFIVFVFSAGGLFAQTANTASLSFYETLDVQAVRISGSYDYYLSGDFTLEMWFRCISQQSELPSTLFGVNSRHADAGINGTVSLHFAGDWSAYPMLELMSNSTSLGYGLSTPELFLGSSPQDGNWHHIAVVLDRENNKILAYLDGAPNMVNGVDFYDSSIDGLNGEAGGIPGLGSVHPTSLYCIGALGMYNNVIDNPFDGHISEVSFWERALTIEEIRSRMSGYDVSNEPGLIGLWCLENDNPAANSANPGMWGEGIMVGPGFPNWSTNVPTRGTLIDWPVIPAEIVVSTDSLDFGIIGADEIIGTENVDSARVMINNPGGADLVIDSLVFANGDFFSLSARGTPFIIAGGDSDSVWVYVTPAYQNPAFGQMEDTLTIYNNVEIVSLSTSVFMEAEDVSLSVEMTAFTATGSDGKVTLKWIVASELQNSGFEIVRSYEKESGYELIADYLSTPGLMGRGNDATGKTYTFEDASVFNEVKYWYKVVDVSFGGIKTEHGPVMGMATTGVDEPGEPGNTIPLDFAVLGNYPNPFNPVTAIKVTLPEDGLIELKIYNSLGKMIGKMTGPGKTGMNLINFDGTNLASGIYIYTIKFGNDFASRKMLLVK